MKLKCAYCQKENDISFKVSFRDECLFCRRDLHNCKNCAFYDVKSYNECKEPAADRVVDKEKNNYCEFYQPGSGGEQQSTADKAKAAAEALFKKSNS